MKGPVLICGGAGFIGANLAARLAASGQRVLIYDNLSRAGVERNVEWLRRTFRGLIEFQLADIRDGKSLRPCLRDASAVFHFAAQTAVTTSLARPREDFEINALGTLTLLEELRLSGATTPFIFTSTNKVYGNLDRLAVRQQGERYEPQHPAVSKHGVGEDWTLDFQSPYGCSKGSADQYVLDYARSFGMPNIVFRMSCIYGPHQFGTEDQGWVAHFLIQSLLRKPLTIFGDGRQVRDVLFVDDLVTALVLAERNANQLAGRAFNIGGGPDHTVSLLELVEMIGALEGEKPEIRFENWRVGDQRYYVSDIRQFSQATGWRPLVGVREGIRRLFDWLRNTHPASAVDDVLQRGVA